MNEEFQYNALQFFDFSQDHDDIANDSYFDIDEERVPSKQNECPKLFEDVNEKEFLELSHTESDCFFSPMDNGISTSTVYLKGQLRKSLSMNNLPTDKPSDDIKLSNALDEMNLDIPQQPRPNSACSVNQRIGKIPSQDHINRLAQPKYFRSQDNLHGGEQMTLAQAVAKFERGTPKRFRSKPSPKINKAVPLVFGGTKPHSPKLMTTGRTRPVNALSKEELERREYEEARKFKIKANPVSKKVLKGPLKPVIDKKPATVTEPFHLTEVKKTQVVEEEKIPTFKAQPLPKSLLNPFKVQSSTQMPTKAQTPNFSKRLTKSAPQKAESTDKVAHSQIPVKLTQTRPMPFSFEQRDKQRMKKKEEFINKILEEERKAREFHAKPPPKAILRSRNASQELLSDAGSTKSFKRSAENLNTTAVFKARPASVLAMKPFEPKRDENHVVKVEAFRFNTDERVEARHKFDEKIKEKEALVEAYKKEQEELVKKLQEEEVAKLRRQMEHKAQPIKKYKKIEIQSANKVTQPITPKFHTDKIRNKENIHQ